MRTWWQPLGRGHQTDLTEPADRGRQPREKDCGLSQNTSPLRSPLSPPPSHPQGGALRGPTRRVSVEQLPAESSSSPGHEAPGQSAGVVCPAREPRVTRTWGMLSAPLKAQKPGVSRDTLTPHLPFHPKLAWQPRSATACPHPLAAACACPTRHLWWPRQPHGPPGGQGQQASPRTAWCAGRVRG